VLDAYYLAKHDFELSKPKSPRGDSLINPSILKILRAKSLPDTVQGAAGWPRVSDG